MNFDLRWSNSRACVSKHTSRQHFLELRVCSLTMRSIVSKMKHRLGNIHGMRQLILLLPVSSPEPSSFLTPFLSRHSHFPLSVLALSCMSLQALDFSASSVPCGYSSQAWLPRVPSSSKFPRLISGLLFLLTGKLRGQPPLSLPCHPVALCFPIPRQSLVEDLFPPGLPWGEPRGRFPGRQASAPKALGMCWALGTLLPDILLGVWEPLVFMLLAGCGRPAVALHRPYAWFLCSVAHTWACLTPHPHRTVRLSQTL